MFRAACLILVVLMLVGCAPTAPAATSTPLPPTAIPLPEGVRAIEPPKALSDFTLVNQDGKTVHLEDLKGKYTLFSFGYTNCPDVCPITLAHFRQVKEALGEAAAQVRFVFFSVDGARDTPERLKAYLSAFDTEFWGISGPDAAMRALITECAGTYDLHNGGGLIKNYTVDHTAGAFLLTPDGVWVRKYVYATDPTIIAQDILKFLRG